MAYRQPELLSEAHDLSTFSCGEPTLDAWLHQSAQRNQREDAPRVFVVRDDEDRVVAYCALAAGAVVRADAPGNASPSTRETKAADLERRFSASRCFALRKPPSTSVFEQSWCTR
jgi:hypothetical protein